MRNVKLLAILVLALATQACAVNVVTVNHANILLDDHGTSLSADVVESNVK